MTGSRICFARYFAKIALSLQLFFYIFYTNASLALSCTRERTLYDILYIAPTSSIEEIKKAFRQLSLRYHPDKSPTTREAAALYQEIHEAYRLLVNPVQRAIYDKLLSSQFFEFKCQEENKPLTSTTPDNTSDTRFSETVSELFVALKENNYSRFEELLASTYNPNVCHPATQETLLDIAIRTDKLAFVKLLLSYQVNINELNAYNTTPLHMAVAFNRVAIIAELIRHGVQVNQPNGEGETPLMKIAELQTSTLLTIPRMLLEAGASGDIQDKSGDTALHKAAARNNSELIKLLLIYNPNTHLKNKKNQTAHAIALAHGYTLAAQLLQNYQAAQQEVRKHEIIKQEVSDMPWYTYWCTKLWHTALQLFKSKNSN